MLEVGKLYSCSGYYLMLYPDRETAAHAASAHAAAHDAERHAAYWTKKLQKPVSFCDPETPLLVLSVNEKYVEVLAGDKRGWIIYQGWLELKEIYA
jgi:hypothetical protein